MWTFQSSLFCQDPGKELPQKELKLSDHYYVISTMLVENKPNAARLYIGNDFCSY